MSRRKEGGCAHGRIVHDWEPGGEGRSSDRAAACRNMRRQGLVGADISGGDKRCCWQWAGRLEALGAPFVAS